MLLVMICAALFSGLGFLIKDKGQTNRLRNGGRRLLGQGFAGGSLRRLLVVVPGGVGAHAQLARIETIKNRA
ncbi:MAG: hypothetical protein AAF460_09090, partial [Pseudomonadota bacterium]